MSSDTALSDARLAEIEARLDVATADRDVRYRLHERRRDITALLAEVRRLREDLAANAAMLARQCDLAREAETAAGRLRAREAALAGALADMVHQFCYRYVRQGQLHMGTGGLSALEGAFAALGYEDPRPCPDMECQAEGCHEEATCGIPTPDGYKRLCGDHYHEVDAARPKAALEPQP